MKATARLLPKLEALEDRAMLSTCHVTRLGDTGGGFGFRGDLRYCINKVNDEPGPDTIMFRPNVQGTIALTGPLPDLASDIDIQGPGEELLTIDAQQKARVFNVVATGNVEISGLTLTQGRTPDYEKGGGIYNAGKLTLQDCTISDNKGWIEGGGIYNRGTLSISGCLISGNTILQTATYYPFGAGISNDVGGVLVVHGSSISSNWIDGCYNCATSGGGIANHGDASVFYSTISDNKVQGGPSSNDSGFGGGIFNSLGKLLVHSCLISNNTARGDYYGYGGGIANGQAYTSQPGGNVTVINSTITGNLAFANGDGFGESEGGGISTNKGGKLTILQSTIVANLTSGYHDYVTGDGGGVSNEVSALHMHNTIVARNQAKTDGPDFSGVLASSGYNLFQDSDGGSGYAETDLLGIAAKVGPLQDNGGLTHTMALLPGSPAIDAGDNTDAPLWDQRGLGFPRIVNGTIDIGAFEVQATAAPLPAGARRGSPDLAVLITADFNTDNTNWRI